LGHRIARGHRRRRYRATPPPCGCGVPLRTVRIPLIARLELGGCERRRGMMMDNDHSEPEKEHLLEEYKICHEAASDMSDHIWRTATVFTVGSITGILLLARESPISPDPDPWLTLIVSVLAIGILSTWWRLARRWWSVQHTMFLRMRHIEYQLGLGASLYVVTGPIV
jgi:hypothetical protein